MKNAILFCALGSLLVLCATAQNQASRNRRNNLNINTHGSGDTCADLQATSNGELAQAVEKFNLSRAEVPTLELTGGQNGVLDVRGWKQSGYSIEVCKLAAAEDRGTADSMLRGISLSHSAGRFSYTGPSGENGSWQIHFIVHTPDSASLDLQTTNGPISVSDVNGNIKVRAVNGPVSLRGSSGNIDAQTTNGPIAFTGEGGEVHLHAVNGPISVKVQNEIWSGSTLEARTNNGPMSVSFPTTFQSGVRVEASGHSPVSCNHEACSHAYTNWSGDKKVMQMNGSSDTIRIYTENGPLSISAPKVGQALSPAR